MESSAKATYHLANPYTMLLAKGLELEKATYTGNVDLFLSRGRESCLRRAEVLSMKSLLGQAIFCVGVPFGLFVVRLGSRK